MNTQEIINYYNEGNSQLKCIKKFKCSSKTLREILNKNKIERRSKSSANRKYFCDDNYFEKIDSNDKAYFLGLLMADGWNKGNGFGISLLEKDKHILEEFKKRIQYTGNLLCYINKSSSKNNKMYSLIITSKKISEDLIKHNVVISKTNNTKFPNIPKEFHSHFIRGVFDGDGYIGIQDNKHLSFNIVGNKELISKIQDILVENCGINKNKLIPYKHKDNNIVYVSYKGNLQNKKIREYLYKDCEDLYLKRKKEKFYDL